MTNEILTLALVISGLLMGLMAAGVVAAVISAMIWQLFPNCSFASWLKAEVFQEEHITLKSEHQDWIAKRMSK